MKKIVIIAIATLINISIYAQDISGKWNGVLKVDGTDLGLSINITKTGDELSATMDVPKQGAIGIPVTTISYENSILKFEITDAGIQYEATLNKENAFVGTFKQGGQSFPLVLSKGRKDDAHKVQEIDVNFAKIQGTGTDHEKTLKSIVKVRDISEQYATGGLYLITHYGNLDRLFQIENQKLIDYPWMDQTWRFCSIFSTTTKENGVVIGRNWDNQNVGSIIVSHYKPDDGYASISFSRAIDMGFPMNLDLSDMAKTPFGKKLLIAPFYAYDGMNEHGLCAMVTGINISVKVSPKEGKESLFIGYIVRKLLDHSKTVDEAIKLVENYIPFDLSLTQINCHFFVSDASGKSVILEYLDNEWEKSYSAKNWQVMTNNVISDVPDTLLRKKCRRYDTISTLLDKTNGNLNWNEGMQVLKDVSQDGTTWSVIYLPNSKELYFSVYQSWDKIYHIQGF
ncbi:MAG: linear amide C-N hydrolase [Bacteroidales bacterium]|nr:linear amide C-N hydrolase [Bacteroidales bacterium]